jgi:hypothetical protein
VWRIFERNLLSFQNLTVMKVFCWKLDLIKPWKSEHWWGYLIENRLDLSLKRRILMRLFNKKLKQIELKNQRFLGNKCRVLQATWVWCWNCNVMEKVGMHHYNFVKNLNVTSWWTFVAFFFVMVIVRKVFMYDKWGILLKVWQKWENLLLCCTFFFFSSYSYLKTFYQVVCLSFVYILL